MNLESPDMCVVKECLQGVGLYEETMNKDEMVEYYKVIKTSESTATEENKRRQHNNNKEELENLDSSLDLIDVSPEINTRKNSKRAYTPKTATVRKRLLDVSTPSTSSTNNNKEMLSFNEIRSNLNAVDIFQSNIKGRKNLEVAQVPNNFGPYYCHKSLDNLPVHERVKRVMFYHSALTETYYALQRSSINLAQLGNPICQNGRFNGDLEKNNFRKDSDEMEDFELPTSEVYTSRGGRPIKRKIYSEDVQSDEESETEKKKTKTDNQKPVRKTNIKKMSKEEIMNRSSLFADSPRSSKTRSDKLFDQLQSDEPKRKKAEQERDKLEASLDPLGEDFDLKITSSQSLVPSITAPEADAVGEEAESSTFTKKRVLPPLIGRKGYKRNQILVPETIKKVNNERSSSPLNKNIDVDVIEVKRSTPNKGPKKKQACPICNETFSQRDIETHASTCGLTCELEIESSLPTQDNSGITCEICDTKFQLNTGYEVHVVECLKKHKNS